MPRSKPAASRPVTAAVCVAPLLLFAASPHSEQQPLRTGTDLIRVDVSVVDRDESPVTGLRPEDFTVLEDGRAQPVRSFAEIALPEPETLPAAWMRDVAPDVHRNADLGEHRLVVIVLDDG